MNNPGNENLEAALESLPEKVSQALQIWRIATLEREKVEALLYARFRAEDERTVQEVKSLINASPGRYQAVLEEIKAEAAYQLVYERLLSAKKRASLRTAY